ncbi:hypothetical protein Tco_0250608 [Tanacetum coccineum]
MLLTREKRIESLAMASRLTNTRLGDMMRYSLIQNIKRVTWLTTFAKLARPKPDMHSGEADVLKDMSGPESLILQATKHCKSINNVFYWIQLCTSKQPATKPEDEHENEGRNTTLGKERTVVIYGNLLNPVVVMMSLVVTMMAAAPAPTSDVFQELFIRFEDTKPRLKLQKREKVDDTKAPANMSLSQKRSPTVKALNTEAKGNYSIVPFAATTFAPGDYTELGRGLGYSRDCKLDRLGCHRELG